MQNIVSFKTYENQNLTRSLGLIWLMHSTHRVADMVSHYKSITSTSHLQQHTGHRTESKKILGKVHFETGHHSLLYKTSQIPFEV